MTRIGEDSIFPTLLQFAANELDVPRIIIEKDYWVTETLRALAEYHPGEFVFKGGTSLSKCFHLVDRFSEDIDILLTDSFSSGGQRDRVMKSMQQTVIDRLTMTIHGIPISNRGVRREVDFDWPRHLTDPGGTLTATSGVTPSIKLEMGTRGGATPTIACPVRSMLVDALVASNPGAARTALPAHDLAAFEVQALHPGRTLVEKLLLLNEHARRLDVGEIDELPARHGRHLYDVIQLLGSPLVLEFLADREAFLDAVAHAESISAEHWGATESRPTGGFAHGALDGQHEVVVDEFAASYEIDVPKLFIGTDSPPPGELFWQRMSNLSALL